MAHKKAGGSASNLRDSQGQRLGVKLADGQYAKAGAIIVRQRGSQVRPGVNVKQGKDFSLFAAIPGIVKFTSRKLRKFNNQLEDGKFVSVLPKQ